MPRTLQRRSGSAYKTGAARAGRVALAVLTTIPATVVFLIAQRRVMSGMSEGAVKG